MSIRLPEILFMGFFFNVKFHWCFLVMPHIPDTEADKPKPRNRGSQKEESVSKCL